ncbi:MAG: efflux RND transporter permease subunit [Sphingobacteriia bacterium]|nr:efflux RND transporter permease subunit [Sphingobacteriia bacterium]NCC39088.1 efflux RND transporter permease subunit [Gammaproteobacteria bacterium]
MVEIAIRRPVLTWLLILLCLIGGLWGLTTLGRLEDPAFSIKQALIFTAYPGASAEEVEREVTERLESVVQQMPQLKRVISKSMPGMSQIEVEIDDHYGPREMPQVWDELRRRIGDAQDDLPDGARRSIVNDDFGDVFGLFYAVTAPGFSAAEQRELGRLLRRELLTVPGVSKVELAGLPEEAIYIELPSERLNTLGIAPEAILGLFRAESDLPAVGRSSIGDREIRIGPRGGLDSLTDIERLRIGPAGGTGLISILDIARISRLEIEPPAHLIHHNGERAFTLAVAGNATSNIVTIGKAVDAHLASLAEAIPLGVTLSPIYQQHLVVEQAIDAFIVSLAQSIAIVIGVLFLFMGWRVGVIVGATLLLTVLGTLFFMRLLGIEMERISLGALIIAMGMLVDNAIVLAEGMLIGMQRGATAIQAARVAASRTQIPLLGATVIGIMAFSGIGLSPDVTGEFLFSLFAVIAISLLLSWVLAITVTPLLGSYLLRTTPPEARRDPYGGRPYRAYRALLGLSLRARWLVVLILVAITAASIAAFGLVKQAFFPNSNTPLFYVHYQLPQGSDLRATARDLATLERLVSEQPEVTAVTGFVGRGASRFMLTYAPEQTNAAYGQLIVRTAALADIDPLIARLRGELASAVPNGELRTERLVFGPPSGATVAVRFSGEDPVVLRALGEQAMAIFRASGVLRDIRTDWRQRELSVVPIFDEERARMAGVGRADLALKLEFATSGTRAGTFRESDAQIPIIVRAPPAERGGIASLRDRRVWSSAAGGYVPITQVVSRFETRAEEALIHRRDRLRTLTVMSSEIPGLTADAAFRQVRPAIEALTLPPHYGIEWGGEFEAAKEANAGLAGSLPAGILVMLVISVLLFGKVRQPLILWLVVPMSVTGMVLGLLIADLPFTFTALLGLLSLSGMLMKNAIVLVEEIDRQIAEGQPGVTAIREACVSRLRPVVLAAATTILGMVPLLTDAFFASMAVTIMGGLAFASVLTLIAVPVLYAFLFGIRGQADWRMRTAARTPSTVAMEPRE